MGALIVNIAGPSTTGKTTILEDLKKALACEVCFENIRVKYVEERCRQVFKDWWSHLYPNLEALCRSKDSMNWEQSLASDWVTETVDDRDNYDVIFCDRGPIDMLAYTLMIGTIYHEQYQETILWQETLIQHIDVLFKTVPFKEDSFKDDGFRSKDYYNNRAAEILFFDMAMNNYFTENLNMFTLPEGKEDRLVYIIEETVDELIARGVLKEEDTWPR